MEDASFRLSDTYSSGYYTSTSPELQDDEVFTEPSLETAYKVGKEEVLKVSAETQTSPEDTKSTTRKTVLRASEIVGDISEMNFPERARESLFYITPFTVIKYFMALDDEKISGVVQDYLPMFGENTKELLFFLNEDISQHAKIILSTYIFGKKLATNEANSPEKERELTLWAREKVAELTQRNESPQDQYAREKAVLNDALVYIQKHTTKIMLKASEIAKAESTMSLGRDIKSTTETHAQ